MNARPHPIRPRHLALLSSLLVAGARADQSGPFTYQVADGEVTITDYTGTGEGHVEIPPAIDGFPVTSIGSFAMSLIPMTSVEIPESIVTIGDFAFTGCTALGSVTIPSSVTSLGAGAFFECYGLRSLVIEGGGLAMGASSFTRCLTLEEVHLPEGMTEIADFGFSGCGLLKAIEMPDTIKRVGVGAFHGCSQLARVRFSSGVTEIADSTFQFCDGLTTLFIPPFIDRIGEKAFSSCNGLTSVTIPASVTAIGRHAFEHCSSLQSAIFLGDAPPVFLNGGPGSFPPDGVFRYAPDGFTVYFSEGAAGFSAPAWMGYPSTPLDVVALPPAPWLVAYGLPLDSDMARPLDGGAISLLAAYAFRLDPHAPDAGDLPGAEASPGAVRLRFHGASPGITYGGESSADLTTWSTDGVSMSDPDVRGIRTLSLPPTRPAGFLRARADLNW